MTLLVATTANSSTKSCHPFARPLCLRGVKFVCCHLFAALFSCHLLARGEIIRKSGNPAETQPPEDLDREILAGKWAVLLPGCSPNQQISAISLGFMRAGSKLHTCIHVRKHMHTHMPIRIDMNMITHTHIGIRIHICIRIHMHIPVSIHIHIHMAHMICMSYDMMCVYIYIYIYVH